MDKCDYCGDSFPMADMELKELSLKDKERIVDADLDTRDVTALPDSQKEEEQSLSPYILGLNWQLGKFIRLFLTPEVYESARTNRIRLTFPKDKERPWAYSNENGDLIIDSVSEILETTDLQTIEYEDFLELAIGQLKRKPSSAAPIISTLESQLANFEMAAVIQFSMNVADKLLESVAVRTFGLE
jgi:hypothetical protein